MVHRLALCIVSVAASLFAMTDAHSYLVKPVSRTTNYFADTENKVGCPTDKVGQISSFKAGEQIDVRYWRNNHIGGFIRWSLSPRGNETKEDFDKNAFFYTCRESGPDCVPKRDPGRPITGDSSGDNTISCGDKITLPDWLPAGDYVLQWTWFGVGHSNGNLGWAEPQFRSCADIKLTTSGAKTAAPQCPTFVGGDRVTKYQNKTSDQCFYFYTTEITSTWYKGSNDESIAMPLYKYGVPAAVSQCSGKTSDGSSKSEDDATGKDEDAESPSPSTKTPQPSTAPPKPATTTAAPATKTPTPAGTPISCRRKED